MFMYIYVLLCSDLEFKKFNIPIKDIETPL